MKSLRKLDLKVIVISLIIFAILQGLLSSDTLDAFWELNMIVICINIILSVSLNLINGYTGQFSLGHAGFMAIGAYTGAVLTVNFHMPFLISLIASFITAAIIGGLIGLPTMRLSGDYLAIATLGLGEIIRIVIMNVNYVGGAAGFMGIPRYTTFAWAFFVMLFVVFFIKNYVNSSFGRACIAIRENEIAAETMGINTTVYKVLAFTIGAGFAGVAGCLFAHVICIAHPSSFTFLASFNYLIMIVLGGLGSITGSIAGAFVLTSLSALLSAWPELRMSIYAVILILLMFYRPQGLFGNIELTSLPIFKRFKGGK
ncbi:branched-chain amino acid ABC transporter permease [Pectinatus sottacetonis]|uniref:branched-chain amino acid ABC transporter permease n=1 Tax=Pectinatus sottacetonis TaxID=1002795 RepID=UPI0018C65BB9|nr:branched-chain amino acid ABC transporter permease [Pectinatus sottacetonis]